MTKKKSEEDRNMDYGKYLTEKSLAHYLKILKDEKCGGIFTRFTPEAEVLMEEKHVWFFGRAMWSFAMAYLHIEKRKEYLDICDYIFDFLKKIEFVDNRLPVWVTREGKLFKGPDCGGYNEGFIAVGCAQYYRVTGREDVKEYAERCFDILYDSYFDLLDKRQNDLDDPVPTQVLGLNMAQLNNAQFVRNAGIRVEKANELAAKCVQQLKLHINEEKKLAPENRPLPGYELTKEMNYFVPGHVYEAAWFVLTEAEYRGDEEMALIGKKLLDYAMPQGFDKMARLIPTTVPTDEPYNFGLEEYLISWPQQEAIVAYNLAYRMFGEEKYKRLADAIEETALAYFADDAANRWYKAIHISSPVVKERTDKGYHPEGPFHHERMLIAMDILLRDGNLKRYIS